MNIIWGINELSFKNCPKCWEQCLWRGGASSERLSTVNEENLCHNDKVMTSHCESASQVLWQKSCSKKLQCQQSDAIVHQELEATQIKQETVAQIH